MGPRRIARGGSTTERAIAHAQDHCVARGAGGRCGDVPRRLRFQLERQQHQLQQLVLELLGQRLQLHVGLRPGRRQGRQGRHHPAGHHVLAALGHRRPRGAQGQLQDLQPRLQHPERRRLRQQDADHRPLDDLPGRQGADDRQPRPGVRRQDRAGGLQGRRHPGRLRPAHAGWRRGPLRLLRQRQGGRGAGQDPDPVPAGRGREERQVRPDRRRGHRQQRHAVQAGLRGVLTKTPGWTKVAEQDGNWDAPTAGRQFSAMLGKTRTSRPSWSPTTRWPAR